MNTPPHSDFSDSAVVGKVLLFVVVVSPVLLLAVSAEFGEETKSAVLALLASSAAALLLLGEPRPLPAARLGYDGLPLGGLDLARAGEVDGLSHLARDLVIPPSGGLLVNEVAQALVRLPARHLVHGHGQVDAPLARPLVPVHAHEPRRVAPELLLDCLLLARPGKVDRPPERGHGRVVGPRRLKLRVEAAQREGRAVDLRLGVPPPGLEPDPDVLAHKHPLRFRAVVGARVVERAAELPRGFVVAASGLLLGGEPAEGNRLLAGRVRAEHRREPVGLLCQVVVRQRHARVPLLGLGVPPDPDHLAHPPPGRLVGLVLVAGRLLHREPLARVREVARAAVRPDVLVVHARRVLLLVHLEEPEPHRPLRPRVGRGRHGGPTVVVPLDTHELGDGALALPQELGRRELLVGPHLRVDAQRLVARLAPRAHLGGLGEVEVPPALLPQEGAGELVIGPGRVLLPREVAQLLDQEGGPLAPRLPRDLADPDVPPLATTTPPPGLPWGGIHAAASGSPGGGATTSAGPFPPSAAVSSSRTLIEAVQR
mmetsp:Transcript_48447/g.110020  ORF Transcript_48447/g.110020 Transcript_48447/m.110020 type:complete len:541 (-) Transcript_48447:347-1969(-)